MPRNAILSMIFLAFLFSCSDKKDETEPTKEFGKLVIRFTHRYDGNVLEYDTARYFNSAGNFMLFSELQYFISDVTLHYADGSKYLINRWKDIHYVDSDIPSTMEWNVYDSIPPGRVDSLSFTFGIDEEKNTSFRYVNPPESLMFWPDILGGGYHYLKLNGKWLNEQQLFNPFNFHLGIGQIYDQNGNITGFIQNYFDISLKDKGFEMIDGKTITIGIIMNVESWFDTPIVWDFNQWGGDIMQNQDAMHAACINGHDVFSLEVDD